MEKDGNEVISLRREKYLTEGDPVALIVSDGATAGTEGQGCRKPLTQLPAPCRDVTLQQ